MANYLQGSVDFIPQIQDFNPDLNYYAGVLATKQSQYNQGLSKVNSIYSSVFNSPLTRQDNSERRDKYFKTIEQQVKKVAGMDLSVDQNVTTANTLFDPILNDKDIVNDMVKTKAWHNALSTGEQYRNCVDPDKCGGSYWEEGMQKIQYEMEDFRKASPEDAMRMQASKYTPKIDVQKKAFKAIKDAGFDVQSEYVKGGYNITDTNGYLLLGKADKNGKKASNGILPQFLYGMFGNDGAVQDMYKTQAYVQRKSASKQIAAEKGISEAEAESEYLHGIMAQAVPKLEQSKADLERHDEKLKVDSDALEIVARDKGYGDSVEEAYAKIQDLRKKIKPAEAFHEAATNLIKTAPNLNDLNAMRNRVDGIVANAHFTQAMNSTAYEYAMGTAKHKMEENKYSLAAYNNKLDLEKSKELKRMDHALRIDLEERLGKIGGGNKGQDIINALGKKNITLAQLAPLGIDLSNINTPAARKILLQKGIFTNEEVNSGELAFATGGENTVDTHVKNGQIYGRAVDNAHTASVNFVKSTVAGLQKAYNEAASNPDKNKANTIQNKILNDAADMFKDSGINIQDLLSGNTSSDIWDNHPKLGTVTDMMMQKRKQDPAAQVYSADWSDKDFSDLQVAQQTAQGLQKVREGIMKSAVKEVILGMPDKAHVAEESGKIASMIGEGGQILPVLDAFKKYWTTVPHSGDAQQEMANFVQGYDMRYKALVGKMKAIDSKAGSQDEGGSVGVGKDIIHNINTSSEFATNTLDFKNLLQETKDNPMVTVLGGVSKDFSDLNESPTSSAVANYVMNKVISGDKSKGMNLTTQTQYLPQQGKVGVKVTVNSDDALREAMGLKKTDPIEESMRTFVIALPENSVAGNKFINKTATSPTDALLQNSDRGISVELPEKGTGSIFNKEGRLYGKVEAMGYVESEDPETHKIVFKKTQPLKAEFLLPPVDSKPALDIITSKVNEIYLQQENRKIYWEAAQKQKQLQNARSGKQH